MSCIAVAIDSISVYLNAVKIEFAHCIDSLILTLKFSSIEFTSLVQYVSLPCLGLNHATFLSNSHVVSFLVPTSFLFWFWGNFIRSYPTCCHVFVPFADTLCLISEHCDGQVDNLLTF